jgi:hypothetical protein
MLNCGSSTPVEGSPSGALAVDDSNLYWMTEVSSCAENGWDPPNATPRNVMRTSLCRGATAVLASQLPNMELRTDTIALSGPALYLASYPSTSGTTSPLWEVPLAGGCPTTVTSRYFPTSVAADATNLYWTDEHIQTVVKLPTAGGAPTALAEPLGGDPYELAVDDTGFYFWVEGVGIEHMPLEGGGASLLAPGSLADHVQHLVVNGGNVYWSLIHSDVSLSFTALMSVPASGGTPTLLSSDPVFGFATDGANIYWTVSKCDDSVANPYCSGSLQKMPVGGGTPITLASGWTFNDVSAVAVDATSVYWTSGNTVMKWTPK